MRRLGQDMKATTFWASNLIRKLHCFTYAELVSLHRDAELVSNIVFACARSQIGPVIQHDALLCAESRTLHLCTAKPAPKSVRFRKCFSLKRSP